MWYFGMGEVSMQGPQTDDQPTLSRTEIQNGGLNFYLPHLILYFVFYKTIQHENYQLVYYVGSMKWQ